jgi:hypothetical protein
MVHRIDADPAVPRLAFQGLLDGAALAELARAAGALAAGRRVQVRLLAGTEVDPACAVALRNLPGVDLQADSAFLARWLGTAPAASGVSTTGASR